MISCLDLLFGLLQKLFSRCFCPIGNKKGPFFFTVFNNIQIIKNQYCIRNRHDIFFPGCYFHQFPSIFIGKISYCPGHQRKVCLIFIFMVLKIFPEIFFKSNLCFFYIVNKKTISIFQQFQIWIATYYGVSTQIIYKGRIQKHTVSFFSQDLKDFCG